MSKEQQPFDPASADIPALERGAKSLRVVFWFVSVVSYPFFIALLLVDHVPIGAAILFVSWLVAVPFLRWAFVHMPSRQLSEARAAQGITATTAFGR
jgi:hypothetical protein